MRDLIQKAADNCAEGSLRALARMLETPERTLYAWMSGERPAPGTARILIRLLAEQPRLAKSVAIAGRAE